MSKSNTSPSKGKPSVNEKEKGSRPSLLLLRTGIRAETGEPFLQNAPAFFPDSGVLVQKTISASTCPAQHRPPSRAGQNQRTVFAEGMALSYLLLRKPVKNLNLRIHPDGTVLLSAAPSVPEWEADAFIVRHAGWVRQAQARVRRSPNFSALDPSLADGMRFPYLGKEVCLHLQAGKQGWRFSPPSGSAGELLLLLPDPDAEAALKKLFFAWRKEQCAALFPPLVERFYHLAGSPGPLPRLELRQMKSRWGSCTKASGRISLNCCLLHTPLPCVEYVAAHEVAHLLEANHSPAFYRALCALLPDWAERRELLRRQDIL